MRMSGLTQTKAFPGTPVRMVIAGRPVDTDTWRASEPMPIFFITQIWAVEFDRRQTRDMERFRVCGTASADMRVMAWQNRFGAKTIGMRR